MSDRILIASFRGLVSQLGGVEAAAAVLEEAYGAASKGTVSKMCSGQAEITVAAMRAIEDALGVYPMTTRLFERIGCEAGRGDDLRAMAARIAQDSGSAVSQLILGFSASSPDPDQLTEDERARVHVAARALRSDCDAVIAATEPPASVARLRT